MAWIEYRNTDEIPERDRVPDEDHIIQVHSVHSRVMKHHFDLYVELMHRRSPLSRIQREMIAVAISNVNACHY